jgi:predicted Fe-S protein YdhL (DUF1289 family)
LIKPGFFWTESLTNIPTALPVPSPCTGVCCLDRQGFCEGCHRTGEEIAGWLQMSDHQRRWLMDHVLPHREAKQAG